MSPRKTVIVLTILVVAGAGIAYPVQVGVALGLFGLCVVGSVTLGTIMCAICEDEWIWSAGKRKRDSDG